MAGLNKEFFDNLIKDTKFVVAQDGSLMNSRNKVTTPLYAINCIYGGGLPLGIITRISGHPGSGKSTFSYQCMANYQKEYEDGVPVIYDMEASMDDSRLKVLGVDTDKVLRLPATSLEEAFSSMFALLNKLSKLVEEYPTLTSFQIYDTISTGGTDKQHNNIENGGNAFNAGSMMEAPRIIKQNLSNLFPYIEKFPVFLGLLEQVFTQMGAYTSTVTASGSFGLAHACHAHLVFGKPNDIYDKGFLVGTESMLKLQKSKLSPKFVDIPCYIDVTAGGKIDEAESFFRYISSTNINIIKAGSWYTIGDTIDKAIERYPDLNKDAILPYKKSYRKNDICTLIKNDKNFLNFLQVYFTDFIDDIYPGQRDINSAYQKELKSKCEFFEKTDTDIPEEE